MATPQPLPPPTAFRHSAVDTSDRLPPGTERRPIFIYAHYWTGWQYAETAADGTVIDPAEHGRGKGVGEWLPTLTKIPIVKGSGGAHTDRDIPAAVKRVQGGGGVVLLPHDKRLGPYGDYLQVYLDLQGGQHFAELFEVAVRMPNGGVTFQEGDRRKYIAMLRHVRDNAVDPMSPQAFATLRGRLATEVERLRELSVTSGRGTAQLEIKERLLAAWDVAWEREQRRAAEALAGVVPMAPSAGPTDVDWAAAAAAVRPRTIAPAQAAPVEAAPAPVQAADDLTDAERLLAEAKPRRRRVQPAQTEG